MGQADDFAVVDGLIDRSVRQVVHPRLLCKIVKVFVRIIGLYIRASVTQQNIRLLNLPFYRSLHAFFKFFFWNLYHFQIIFRQILITI